MGGTTTMVYDERDRLKESTDGRGKVFYVKYDVFNRVIEAGEKVGTTENMLSRQHFDSYSPSFGGNEAFVSAGGDYSTTYCSSIKGKPTVSAKRVLNPNDTYGSWLYQTVYYDERFNPIHTISSLFDIGGTAKERASVVRRFDGRAEKEIVLQQTGSGDYSVEKIYAYDHRDRKLSSRYIVKKGSDTKKDVYLSAVRYNAIGQLKNKYLHSTDGGSKYLEKLDYCYTPRNFLSKITGSVSAGENFGVELRYTNPSAGTTAQYNGNIAEMLWKRGSNWVGYKFTYDKANRMTNAAGSNNNYSETISGFDRNGNITGLQRVSNGTTIDNLSYDYASSGNRLMKVTDAANNSSGFNNGSSGTSEDYAYDGNGNLTKDLNRGIQADGLRYNVSNLVREVAIGSYTLQYHYDAIGSKLRMSNSNGAVNTKYSGLFEYNQGNYLTRVATEEGQVNITNNGNDFALEYYLTDHQGNVRQVISESGTVVQETEYYPFGLAIERTVGVNKYTFLGKEKQPETNWIDLQARFYDPTTGRFMNVDPETEGQLEFSRYHYSFNNPIRFSDPDGEMPTAVIGALIGATVGGGIEAGRQLYQHGGIDNWRAVGGAAIQGGITGAVTGLTGGANLLAATSAAAGANALGGALNRSLQGQTTSAKDLAVDAAVGGTIGAAGKIIGNVVSNVTNNLTNAAKGKLGEAITKLKYAAQGYKSAGKAEVFTGGRTATGRQARALYDHKMTNVFTGKQLTVESKFNGSNLTPNQVAAQSRVTTPGGLIVDRTTSQGLGNGANAATVGGGAGVGAQRKRATFMFISN